MLDHLKEELEKKGFILVSRDLTEIYKKLTDTSKDKYVWRLIMFIIEFIESYKTTGYDEGGFAVLKNKTDNIRTQMFLEIVEEVYIYYQEQLRKNDQIDFADMIKYSEVIRNRSGGYYMLLNYTFQNFRSFKNKTQLSMNAGVNKIFRRDQIKFVEKDKDTYESIIYSLADLGSTDVRNDHNYLLNYFKGKYRILPYIDFSKLFADVAEEDK